MGTPSWLQRRLQLLHTWRAHSMSAECIVNPMYNGQAHDMSPPEHTADCSCCESGAGAGDWLGTTARDLNVPSPRSKPGSRLPREQGSINKAAVLQKRCNVPGGLP